MATIVLKDIGYFETGDTFCIDVTITNSDEANSGNIAQNVETTVTLPDGLIFQVGGSTVDQGVFDEVTGMWAIGSILPCHDVTASFCFQIDDDCEANPFLIDVDTTSDACDCSLTNADLQYSVDGTSCCDFINCGKISHDSYADDVAAAAGSVPVGGHYFNTTTGIMHTRMT